MAAVTGYAVGHASWVMLISLCIYYLYDLYQLRRFNLWLNRDTSKSDSDPRESFGLWGDIFDGRYRLQKQERRARSHLSNILDTAHAFELVCPFSLRLVGKRSELYSAISNLVVNAAKYTPAGGNIKLSADKETNF